MQVYEIKKFTFGDAFSSTGGFRANIQSILGFISAIILPYFFWNKLSK